LDQPCFRRFNNPFASAFLSRDVDPEFHKPLSYLYTNPRLKALHFRDINLQTFFYLFYTFPD
jgi:hypothetical protein